MRSTKPQVLSRMSEDEKRESKGMERDRQQVWPYFSTNQKTEEEKARDRKNKTNNKSTVGECEKEE